MKFGELLKNSMYPPFAEGYLKYDELKKKIKVAATSSPATSPEPPKEKFSEILIAEVRRIDEYATALKRKYAARLDEVEKKWKDVKSWKQSNFPNVDQHIRKTHLEYLEINEELDHLIDFIQLNIVGVQKIIKKHDRLTGEMTGPLLMAKLQRGSAVSTEPSSSSVKGKSTMNEKKTKKRGEEEEGGNVGEEAAFQPSSLSTNGRDPSGGYLHHLSDVASVALLVDRARDGITDVASVLTGKTASSLQQDQQEFHNKWRNFDTFARPIGSTKNAGGFFMGGLFSTSPPNVARLSPQPPPLGSGKEKDERTRLLAKSTSEGGARSANADLTTMVGSTNTLFLQQQQQLRLFQREREAELERSRLHRFLEAVARPMLVPSSSSSLTLGPQPSSPRNPPATTPLPFALISLFGACLSGIGLGVIYATLQGYESLASSSSPSSPSSGNQDTFVYVAVLLSLALGGMTSRSYENSETFALLLAAMGAVSASIVALSSAANFPVVLLACWMYGVCARAWSGTVPREFVTGSSRSVVAAASVMPSCGTLIGALLARQFGRSLSVAVVAVCWCVVIVIMSAADYSGGKASTSSSSSDSTGGGGLALHSTPSSLASSFNARSHSRGSEGYGTEEEYEDVSEDSELGEDDAEQGLFGINGSTTVATGSAAAAQSAASVKASKISAAHSRWRRASFSATSWTTLSSLFLLRGPIR